ncbi:MAG TPA: hypothetical protein VNF68_00865, partial [Candidatus Baltobacteraceae bacterium]|nr:hypothetical protein [Candidatus Baltobacteraceae bacterium]
MVWSIAGLSTSLLVAVFAGWRSLRPAGYYDGDVYGMTRTTHLRYLGVSLLLALAFLATLVAHVEWLVFWLLAAAVLVAI